MREDEENKASQNLSATPHTSVPEDAREDASPNVADEEVLQSSRMHTRRSFAVAAAAAVAGYGFYRWVGYSHSIAMQPAPLRRAFQANAKISRAVFDERALAPTYPVARSVELRTNGIYGLKRALVPESWRLQMVGVEGAEHDPRYTPDVTAWQYRYTEEQNHEDQGHDTKVPPSADTAVKMAPKSMQAFAAKMQQLSSRLPRGQEEAGLSRSTLPPGTPGLLLTIDDVLRFPRHELVTQFKCIEGWSEIVHWGGVRLADLIAAYPPKKLASGALPRYVYMETPNGDYYCGYTLDICRHPQSLLVTEMAGKPLTQFHGAPLRLHMPTKYGYKQLKRIALIAYTDTKPDDYWTKLGYDWYAGL